MSNFKIQIANLVVTVDAMFESTRIFCRNHFSQQEPDLSVRTGMEDICFERTKAVREIQLEGCSFRDISDAQLEITAIQRKITEAFFSRHILLFHGSVVAVDGAAYLFTAKSGTGKSTHTRLWREMLGDRAVMVNDDKPFLQMTQDGVTAWGSPWNGKHKLGANIGVPLKAICILERSETNWIKPVQVPEVLPMLFQQSQRPQDPANMAKYMELVDELANSVEFYRLGCNMDPEAARISYEAMSQGRKDTKV